MKYNSHSTSITVHKPDQVVEEVAGEMGVTKSLLTTALSQIEKAQDTIRRVGTEGWSADAALVWLKDHCDHLWSEVEAISQRNDAAKELLYAVVEHQQNKPE